MRRAVLLLLALAALGLAFFPFRKVDDDGLWPLAVTIRSASGDPIIAASGQAFSGAESAEDTLNALAPPDCRVYSAVQEPFGGEKLNVPVPTSCHTWSGPLCKSSRYYQYTKLVVIVQRGSGRREGRMVEIPDLRQSKEVVVEFP